MTTPPEPTKRDREEADVESADYFQKALPQERTAAHFQQEQHAFLCGFSRGLRAERKRAGKLAIALKMALMRETPDPDHDHQTCENPSCVFGRQALDEYERGGG